MLLDGAMGTMIQGYGLAEDDYRGERFADWESDLKGNNDLLSITRPQVIREIHTGFLEAGADIIETNTFNSNAPSMADYGMESLVFELNLAAARLARECADAHAEKAGSPRYVAGVLGPTNRTASISPDVNDPGYRNIRFADLAATYEEAARALIEGGADFLMIETIFDTLNAKAAIFALKRAFEETGVTLPVMISGTITDASGRTLSGQTPEAFWNSVRHIDPFMIGLNCALGAKDLRPYVDELSRVADTRVSAHPACRTSSVNTTKHRKRWRTSSASLRRAAWSTWSAAAAAPRPNTSPHCGKPLPASARARFPTSPCAAACPDSNR